MKTIITLGISVFTMALFSCNSQKTTKQAQDTITNSVMDTAASKKIVGNDRDDHGCIASAGYQWSAIKKECIRPFELSNKMKDLVDPTLGASMIFSTDNKQVEIFAADFTPALLLNATADNVYASTDKKYKFEKDSRGHWFLTKTEDGKTTTILQQG